MPDPQKGLPDGWVVEEPGQASSGGEAGPIGSAAGRFVGGVWQSVNPMNLVDAARHPMDTAQALLEAHKAQYDKAKAAYADGRYSEAIGHLGAAALPVLGPAAAAAGEQIASGDVAGGLGAGAGLIGTVLAPKAGMKAVGQAGGAVADVAKAAVTPKTAARLVKYGSTALGGTLGGGFGAVVGSEIGEDLAARVKARLTPVGPIKPHTLMTSQQLGIILDEMQKPPATAPAIPGAAPGGAQAATDTMRALIDQPPIAQRLATPPTTPLTAPVTPQEAILEGAAQQRRGGGGPPSETAVSSPTAFDLAAKKQGMAQPRPATPVPLKAAVNAVQQSATAAKVKLTADQFNAATQMVKLGHDPAEVMQAMTVLHELQASPSFANLPSDAEMAKDVTARNATGKWGAGPVR